MNNAIVSLPPSRGKPLNNFMSAYEGDDSVFGASRPGYPGYNVTKEQVEEWISFMKQKGIHSVVCLLDQSQLAAIKSVNLIEEYKKAFGADNVLSAPIPDFTLAKPDLLWGKIIPFIKSAQKPVVVHCAGGIGRTGHVLCAWLVSKYSMDPMDAALYLQKRLRNPLEAVDARHATMESFVKLMTPQEE